MHTHNVKVVVCTYRGAAPESSSGQQWRIIKAEANTNKKVSRWQIMIMNADYECCKDYMLSPTAPNVRPCVNNDIMIKFNINWSMPACGILMMNDHNPTQPLEFVKHTSPTYVNFVIFENCHSRTFCPKSLSITEIHAIQAKDNKGTLQ